MMNDPRERATKMRIIQVVFTAGRCDAAWRFEGEREWAIVPVAELGARLERADGYARDAQTRAKGEQLGG